MDKNLQQCLDNEVPGKYIFPLFWHHGEPNDVIEKEIDAVYNCGIREICVESRVHEQFCEDQWWKDFGFILQEAKKRGMRVWLLDDKYYPSGYANGYIRNHPELRKKALRAEYTDVQGPVCDYAVQADRCTEGEHIVSVSACRTDGTALYGEWIDLNGYLQDDLVWVDFPDGVWRVYFAIETGKTMEASKCNVDMLSAESCAAMIHAIYEPHYQHFGEEFGKTFAGFFADEPAFGNDDHTYRSVLGKEQMLIPWSKDLLREMSNELQIPEEEVLVRLPMLWHAHQDMGEYRTSYMNCASKAAEKNFSGQLGEWCRERNVLYVGHLIEDMNAHMRLGYGLGHFFRGMGGMDMAGMDLVLGQINPGICEQKYPASVTEEYSDPALFQYTLPKMTTSLAQISGLKKGRALCEIFGAFGWGEGLRDMLYLMNVTLSGGINYYVPHAFSPKFMDPDCPPHFYAQGKNPTYPLFGQLMSYMKRCSHLISDGKHFVNVAVLYNAEAEWAGYKMMFPQDVCRELSQHQIDHDIVPSDFIMKADVKDAAFYNEVSARYRCLIIPFSRRLPKALLSKINEIATAGVTVIFVNDYPDLYNGSGMVTALHALAEKVREELPLDAMRFSGSGLKHVVVYRYIRDGQEVVLLFNTSQRECPEFKTEHRKRECCSYYDAWNNTLIPAKEAGECLKMKLYPGEMKIILPGVKASAKDQTAAELKNYALDLKKYREEDASFIRYSVDLKRVGEEQFKSYRHDSDFFNVTGRYERPDFSGVIRYSASVDLEQLPQYLDLGEVGENALVWVNDIDCGTKIARPYCFDIRHAVKQGKNIIRIEVINNLAYAWKDKEFSKYRVLTPSGILGPVKLLYEI